MTRIEELLYSASYPSWDGMDFEILTLSDAELHEYAEAAAIQTTVTHSPTDSAMTAERQRADRT